GIIEAELIYSDVETLEKARQRYQKLTKSGDKKVGPILTMLDALSDHLQNLAPARTFVIEKFVGDTKEVAHAFRDMHLITGKRVLYVCNVDESLAGGDEDNDYTSQVKAHAAKEGDGSVILCGKIEEELAELDDGSRIEMIADMGMNE